MDMTTRRKIADTKSARSVEKILGQASRFEVEQAEARLAVPGHRTHQHISFDEYKELLASGKTILDVCAMTSKHLVYFYNAMLDGRIALGRDEFVRLYESGMPLDDIAARHGIPRGHVTFLREFYGIKRKGATFQKRLSSEVPLSDMAKSVIVGSILGDGHIHAGGYWSEKHCEAQADYLRWKASFVPDITTEKSFVPYETFDKRRGRSFRGLSFRTRTHSWLHEMRALFYRDGQKIVPENIAELLNETALAVWFMDDGNTDWGYRNGRKKHLGTEPRCVIHTEGFSHDDVDRLCSVLFDKFGLSCKSSPKDAQRKDKWIIRFTSAASRTLTTMLSIIPARSMQYKRDESSFVSR